MREREKSHSKGKVDATTAAEQAIRGGASLPGERKRIHFPGKEGVVTLSIDDLWGRKRPRFTLAEGGKGNLSSILTGEEKKLDSAGGIMIDVVGKKGGENYAIDQPAGGGEETGNLSFGYRKSGRWRFAAARGGERWRT